MGEFATLLSCSTGSRLFINSWKHAFSIKIDGEIYIDFTALKLQNV